MKKPLYFDYAATTPVDPRVASKMMLFLTSEGVFGNPSSSSYSFGVEAREAVEEARLQVAKLIGAEAHEIIWTSGATESNNIAIKGAAHFFKNRGKHLITLKTEHKAVLENMKALEESGFSITYLKPEQNGIINLSKFESAIHKDTIVVSIMWVNNEIGVIQPISQIGKICRKKRIIFHVDAAQAAGKVDIDVNASNVDLLSLSSHKVYGPKGIGALYIRHQTRNQLLPQIHGGGQEYGLRPGTLPTHQIVCMGEACSIAAKEIKKERSQIEKLYKKLLSGIKEIKEIQINGDLKKRVPHNLNVSFRLVDAESLIMAIKDKVAISSGSACTSESLDPSHVLLALGNDEETAFSSVRLSMGRFTTEKEIEYLIKLLKEEVCKLREISSEWEKNL